MTTRDIEPGDLARVAAELEWLVEPPLFFGGSVVPLYVDDPAVRGDEPRPTEHVDLLISLADKAKQGDVERALRDHGWRLDMRSRRRNTLAYLSCDGIPVDVVLDSQAGADDWIVRGRDHRETFDLQGREIHVPSPAFLVASKIQASLDNPSRWASPYSSHDLADVLVVLFGCTRALQSLREAPADLRTFVANWAGEALSDRMEPAYQALLGDMPRAFTEEDLRATLEQLTVLDEQP